MKRQFIITLHSGQWRIIHRPTCRRFNERGQTANINLFSSCEPQNLVHWKTGKFNTIICQPFDQSPPQWLKVVSDSMYVVKPVP